MTTEQEMHQFMIDLLNKKLIPYIHIPNGLFIHKKSAGAAKKLKNVSDFIFPWNKRVNLLEIGEKGNHIDRKKQQEAYQHLWAVYGNCRTAICYNFEELNSYLKWIKLV